MADRSSRHAGLTSLQATSADAGSEQEVSSIQATNWTERHPEGNSRQAGNPADDGDGTSEERERKSEGAHAADGEPSTAAARSAFQPSRLAQERPADAAGRPKVETAPPPERASAHLESEAPKAPGATRDIKLEVNSGDQRVEVHLMEHGGDVHVAVRTPDTHLAGELRENLPSLSSRLEQTGLRPEEWHTPTPVSGEWHRQIDHSAGSSANDPNGQPRQDTRERQGDPEQRQQPKAFEEQPNRKEKGKEFAWFMSSLH
jgi:hypothetical protein